MKTKLRNITIDGVQYKWIVNFNNDGDGGTFLRVFRQPDKSCIINKQIDHARLPVTPGLVKEEILSI
jgi:hypothetical protein